jgi:hypothetical protein
VSIDNLQCKKDTKNLIIFKDFDKKLEAELFQEWKTKPQGILLISFIIYMYI